MRDVSTTCSSTGGDCLRGYLLGVLAVVCIGALCGGQALAQGFALLDFRDADAIERGLYLGLVDPSTSKRYDATRQAFTVTYQIADDFFASKDPAFQQAAREAVEQALASWSGATNQFINFERASWGAVENHDDFFHPFFAGPSVEEFLACEECWEPGVLPGWGADIDIFTRPTGFVLESGGFTYRMTSNLAAFAAVHRQGGSMWSVDIYLNESRLWTTEEATATAPPNGAPLCACVGSPQVTRTDSAQGILLFDAHPRTHPGIPQGASEVIYDVESVVLHEMGHALGLDHPNQAQGAGGALLDPFTHTVVPGSDVTDDTVMHSHYFGSKRQLAVSDIGGASFLYRPRLWGDLDSDGTLSIADAIRAVELASMTETPSPYDVNMLDFLERNGRIDPDEFALLLGWVFDPESHSIGIIPDRSVLAAANAVNSKTHLIVGAAADPFDIGLGGTVDVLITVDNPDDLQIQGWQLDVTYDNSALSNPRVLDGDFLPDGSFIDPGPDDGELRFAKLGIIGMDDAPFGVLGIIRFDIDLPRAVEVAWLSVDLTNVEVVVASPFVHVYGESDLLPDETLCVLDATATAFDYDVSRDGTINVDDWYQQRLTPVDVDQDGRIDQADAARLRTTLRAGEIADMVSGAVAPVLQ